jgi:hypothetical protein
LPNTVDTLIVVDAHDPESPFVVATLPMESPLDIALADSYAYVICPLELVVVDIRDPTSPHIVGGVYVDHGDGIDLEGSYAYVSEHEGSLQIIDISNPINPVQVGTVNCGFIYDFRVEKGIAYILEGWRLEIVDVTDPNDPVILSQPLLDSYDLEVSEGYLYAHKEGVGILVIDATDPTSPSIVWTEDSLLPPIYLHELVVSGNLLFGLSYWCLEVYDITDSRSPRDRPR